MQNYFRMRKAQKPNRQEIAPCEILQIFGLLKF